MGPRVLKFDGPLARGLWYRRFAAISIYARLRRENHKTAPSCGGEYSLSTLWPAPLSEAMHSEHDLKERQRRTNHSESFPLWGHNPSREALIKSLSDFILEFLFNARNKSTRIASYLRRLMTKHWIKIHMKFDSAN